MSIETPSAQVSVWREPDWVRLWAGDAMTALGSSMGAIAFPLITFSVTGSIQTASVVAAVSAVAYIAGGPWAGWLVDRMDRRRLILVADALGMIVYGLFGVLLWRGGVTAPALLVVAAVTGLRQAVAGPAHAAAVRTILGRTRVASGSAKEQAARAAAQMAGPPAGGLAYSAGAAVPFIATAASFLLDALLILGIKCSLSIDAPTSPTPQKGPKSSIAAFWNEGGAGCTFLCCRTDRRLILLFVATLNLGLSMFYVGINLRLVAAGVTPALIGSVDTAAAAGSLIGAVAASWVIAHINLGRLLPLVATILAVTWIPIAFADDRVTIIAPLTFTMMLAIPATNAALMGYVQAITPDALQGRVMSAGYVLSAAAQPLGPLLAGWSLTTLGPSAATLIPAGAVLAATLALVTDARLRTLGLPDSW